MIPTYVFDKGALVAAERGKKRAARFLKLMRFGRARIVVPLPVIVEWWRGRTDAREEILAATEIVATVEIMAAGIALARAKRVDAKLTIDAIVDRVLRVQIDEQRALRRRIGLPLLARWESLPPTPPTHRRPLEGVARVLR